MYSDDEILTAPTETMHLPVALTDQRRYELSLESAESTIKANRIEEELKRINKSNKQHIEELRVVNTRNAEILTQGKEMLAVPCQKRYDLTHNRVVTVRLDRAETDEGFVVAERALQPGEWASVLASQKAAEGRGR